MSDERNEQSDTDIFDELCGNCAGIKTVTDEDVRLSAEAVNSDPANENDPDFIPYDEDDIQAAIRGRNAYYPEAKNE